MNARDKLRHEMVHGHLCMTGERADELIDAFAAELGTTQHASLRDRTLQEVVVHAEGLRDQAMTRSRAVHLTLGGQWREFMEGLHWDRVADEVRRMAGKEPTT